MNLKDNGRERSVSHLFTNERNQTHTKTSPPRQNKTREFRSEYLIRIALSTIVQSKKRSLANSGWLRKYFIKYKFVVVLVQRSSKIRQRIKKHPSKNKKSVNIRQIIRRPSILFLFISQLTICFCVIFQCFCLQYSNIR